jgi:hypothetical protein
MPRHLPSRTRVVALLPITDHRRNRLLSEEKTHFPAVAQMRRRHQSEHGAVAEASAVPGAPRCDEFGRIPFAQRLTCTIANACQVTGLGRTTICQQIAEGAR